MDIFRREKLHYFGQYIFEEGECLFVSDTEIRVLIWFARTGKLRIGCQYFFRVGRHFNLRNNRDKMLTGIFYDFADIILGIVTAESSRFVETEIFAVAVPPFLPVGIGTPGGKICQPGVFLDFNAPSCRVRKVQMQAVDFIVCQCVYLLLHKVFGEEMPGHVQHQSAIGETGGILHFNGRNGNTFTRSRRQLQECLNPVKQSGSRSCLYQDSGRCDGQRITFRSRQLSALFRYQ